MSCSEDAWFDECDDFEELGGVSCYGVPMEMVGADADADADADALATAPTAATAVAAMVRPSSHLIHVLTRADDGGAERSYLHADPTVSPGLCVSVVVVVVCLSDQCRVTGRCRRRRRQRLGTDEAATRGQVWDRAVGSRRWR
eukprot:COSAG01_NODE_320_length_18904_cov_45.662537_8_plen_143_part_00